jgi:hypothetical protein
MIECEDGFTDVGFDVDCETINVTSNEKELFMMLEISDRVIKLWKKINNHQ